MAKTAPGRRSREDWLAAALDALLADGVEGLRVVALAKALAVTRGSFYWHFRDRQDFLDQLLAHWAQEWTDRVIEHIWELDVKPTKRILATMEHVMLQGLGRYDPPIRAWALYDSRARKIVERVDRKRLRFAQRMFSEAGFAAGEAEARSRMLVVYLIGEHLIATREPPAKRRRMLRKRYRALVAR